VCFAAVRLPALWPRCWCAFFFVGDDGLLTCNHKHSWYRKGESDNWKGLGTHLLSLHPSGGGGGVLL
jgi:hypothetical protein